MVLSTGLTRNPVPDVVGFRGGGNICPTILCSNEILVYECDSV